MSEEPKFRNFLKGSVAGESWFENLFAEKLCSSQISQMRSCGTQVKVGKRQVPMYCYGCTDSVSTQPRMVINKKTVMIPRPYANYRPGRKGYEKFIRNNDKFNIFVKKIEDLTRTYLLSMIGGNEWAKEAYKYFVSCKNIVPFGCRIYDSAFNFLSLNGDYFSQRSAGISAHVDNNDIVSCVVHIGSCNHGGTVYFEDFEGEISRTIKFEHGGFQIGDFSSVCHGTEPWYGNRVSLTFSVKKNIVKFFETYGCHQYDKLIVSNNYRCDNVSINI